MGTNWHYKRAGPAKSILRIEGSYLAPHLLSHHTTYHLDGEMEESTEVTVENRTALQESDFLEVLDPRLWPGGIERETREPPAREANASIRTSTNEAITIEFYNPQGTTSKTRKIILP
jgi:hypothetical protein